MSLERRLEKLEALVPAVETPCGVVRCSTDDAASGWFGRLLDRVGWTRSPRALVIVDRTAPSGSQPEILVRPVAAALLTRREQEIEVLAGSQPGDWHVGIAGRGNTDAWPMQDGLGALISELRVGIRRQNEGHTGGF